MRGGLRRRRQPILKTREEIELMRKAGRIVAEVHELMRRMVRPGVSTAELDAAAEDLIRRRNALPAFKGYPHTGRNDFPATICASVNEELVHGIPSPKRILREGDIISIDVGAIYEGFYGDSAWTYAVGEVDEEARRLMEATEGALYAGIAAARAGHRLREVSAAIQRYVEERGFNVVREYTGHGIGRAMHEPPQVLNYVNEHDVEGRIVMRPGLTIALEPMVNAGTWRTRVLRDGWTVVTADGRLSAHFEHTLVVTNGDPEILTRL
ncbi:MAG: type I methionyl aminopeptidase [Chloroflexi bacterium]|nr:type I methionyl aminopeptidase [Chloroflexota bacterium]